MGATKGNLEVKDKDAKSTKTQVQGPMWWPERFRLRLLWGLPCGWILIINNIDHIVYWVKLQQWSLYFTENLWKWKEFIPDPEELVVRSLARNISLKGYLVQNKCILKLAKRDIKINENYHLFTDISHSSSNEAGISLSVSLSLSMYLYIFLSISLSLSVYLYLYISVYIS